MVQLETNLKHTIIAVVAIVGLMLVIRLVGYQAYGQQNSTEQFRAVQTGLEEYVKSNPTIVDYRIDHNPHIITLYVSVGKEAVTEEQARNFLKTTAILVKEALAETDLSRITVIVCDAATKETLYALDKGSYSLLNTY